VTNISLASICRDTVHAMSKVSVIYLQGRMITEDRTGWLNKYSSVTCIWKTRQLTH